MMGREDMRIGREDRSEEGGRIGGSMDRKQGRKRGRKELSKVGSI